MKDKLREAIKDALVKCNIGDTEITIEVPKDDKNGDYSSNIAMQLTRTLKKNPREIAEMIKENIEFDEIDKIEIAGPGFMNFYLKKDYLFENINKALLDENNYGSSNIGKGRKINIEYVSANPTGFLHIGHARGAAYGDSLANVLKFAGYDVTREYYINDAGNQINNLEKSIIVRYHNLCGLDDTLDENSYHGEDIIAVAKKIYDEYGNSAPDDIFRKRGVDFLLDKIKKDLSKFRVEFDLWSSETDLYESKMVKNTLDSLKSEGYTYTMDNALYLKTTIYGDEKDRVLVKSDSNNTYLLPDIAYHISKYKRGYDKLIDVFGADHHGYIKRLKAAIKMMGEDPDKLDVKILQMVRLIKNGEEIKMSKRTGKTLTLNDLIEEVSVDAARYFFAMRSLDTQLDFDMELAEKKSNENPVYYVGYAHARICSILNEYGKDIKPIKEYKTINSKQALNLLFKIYEFSDIVKMSAERLEPHLITNYVYDLAHLFHTFYACEKVLSDDLEYTLERINLVKATAITINNACRLIGVKAPNKM